MPTKAKAVKTLIAGDTFHYINHTTKLTLTLRVTKNVEAATNNKYTVECETLDERHVIVTYPANAWVTTP